MIILEELLYQQDYAEDHQNGEASDKEPVRQVDF